MRLVSTGHRLSYTIAHRIGKEEKKNKEARLPIVPTTRPGNIDSPFGRLTVDDGHENNVVQQRVRPNQKK